MKLAQALVAHLKSKLGDGYASNAPDSKFWIEEDMHGSTENGFFSEFLLNWDEIEKEIDAFCAEFERSRESQQGDR